MIHYIYNQQIAPPAPFVHVTLRCVQTGAESNEEVAQIDTGADRTVIPTRLVETLQLLPYDELPIGALGGQVLILKTYRLDVAIRRLTPVTLEAVAHPDEPYVLLGRDILNRFRLVLDGPQSSLEIS